MQVRKTMVGLVRRGVVAMAVLVLAASGARAGAPAILHQFAGGAGDGAYPYDSLILSGSTLYGMTLYGGASDLGTIFSIGTDGSGFTVLHTFAGGAADGSWPYGSLILSGSTLYGMTVGGGASDTGTVFSIGTNGSGFAVLHIFSYGAGDGRGPYGSLILSGSTLYGMTNEGGASGQGTVFSIGTNGSGFTLLHSFAGGAGERYPYGSLILSGSTLYGMSCQGGTSGYGTVFSVGTDGSGFAVLHTFAGGAADGEYPLGSLILSGSTLYGMTSQGGASDTGTVFSIGTNGSGFALLHSFAGGAADGASPHYGSLLLSGSTLYGMTSQGGAYNVGVVFALPLGQQLSPRALKQQAAARLTALLPTLNKKLDKTLASAIKDIQESLDPKCWADDTHLTAKNGDKVFNKEHDAVKTLEKIVGSPSVEQDAAQASIDDLVKADDLLATAAIADAVAAGGGNAKAAKEIAKAMAHYDQAVAELAAGKPCDAIESLRKAWDKAQDAIKAVRNTSAE